VPGVNDKAVPARRKDPAPVPPVPKKTQRIIRAGVAFALVCAAAMSAPTLFNLAELVGFKRNLAWLLPACLDGYAGTSILFGAKVPSSHPAYSAATKNARLALALTVFANGGYHLLTLAGTMIPHWLPTALLVTVSSLPPFIVHRLLHLHSLAAGNAATVTATATPAPAAMPAAKPAPVVAPTTPTAPPVVAPRPTTANGNTAASSSNPPAKLLARPERLKIVRGLIATHGNEVPLAVIQEAVGGDKSTASRLRASVLEEPDAEPERVRELAEAAI
jgi:hypothetical protein